MSIRDTIAIGICHYTAGILIREFFRAAENISISRYLSVAGEPGVACGLSGQSYGDLPQASASVHMKRSRATKNACQDMSGPSPGLWVGIDALAPDGKR